MAPNMNLTKKATPETLDHVKTSPEETEKGLSGFDQIKIFTNTVSFVMFASTRIMAKMKSFSLKFIIKYGYTFET